MLPQAKWLPILTLFTVISVVSSCQTTSSNPWFALMEAVTEPQVVSQQDRVVYISEVEYQLKLANFELRQMIRQLRNKKVNQNQAFQGETDSPKKLQAPVSGSHQAQPALPLQNSYSIPPLAQQEFPLSSPKGQANHLHQATTQVSYPPMQKQTPDKITKLSPGLPNPAAYAYRAKWQGLDRDSLQDLARDLAIQQGLSPQLVLALIETESGFNPYAISSSQAYGLMQIKPDQAGREIFPLLHRYEANPSPEYLLNPRRNLNMGLAYLARLKDEYFKNVTDERSQEYLMIAAYNGGIGRVLRFFDENSAQGAINKINSLSAAEVYEKLTQKLPWSETRRYVHKVMKAKTTYELASL